jgi:hypothetical protein
MYIYYNYISRVKVVNDYVILKIISEQLRRLEFDIPTLLSFHQNHRSLVRSYDNVMLLKLIRTLIKINSFVVLK